MRSVVSAYWNSAEVQNFSQNVIVFTLYELWDQKNPGAQARNTGDYWGLHKEQAFHIQPGAQKQETPQHPDRAPSSPRGPTRATCGSMVARTYSWHKFKHETCQTPSGPLDFVLEIFLWVWQTTLHEISRTVLTFVICQSGGNWPVIKLKYNKYNLGVL